MPSPDAHYLFEIHIVKLTLMKYIYVSCIHNGILTLLRKIQHYYTKECLRLNNGKLIHVHCECNPNFYSTQENIHEFPQK